MVPSGTNDSRLTFTAAARSSAAAASLAAASLWGLIGPLSKLSFAAGMDTVEVAFWRTTLAWFFFAVQAVWNRETRVAPRDLPAVAGFGVAGIAGLFGAYVVAVEAGGAALASVLL